MSADRLSCSPSTYQVYRTAFSPNTLSSRCQEAYELSLTQNGVCRLSQFWQAQSWLGTSFTPPVSDCIVSAPRSNRIVSYQSTPSLS